ncbi:hypothetical protein B0H14DRAFT_2386150 [Mycena olivaceomarginata]|nr:hypothetical protein B0H14DRAFT_2386150 [Mycena olivaceomarginata]
MQTLISGPFRAYSGATILMDGLDECDGHDIQQEILCVIRKSPPNHTIPLCFIISRRPEPHICEVFDSPIYIGNYLSSNVEQLFDNVRKYLCNEFSCIHREHSTMASVPYPWPSLGSLKSLVEKSSGHFIYAATIIKLINNKSYCPIQWLAMVQAPPGWTQTQHLIHWTSST